MYLVMPSRVIRFLCSIGSGVNLVLASNVVCCMQDPTDENEDLEGNVDWWCGRLHRAQYGERTHIMYVLSCFLFIVCSAMDVRVHHAFLMISIMAGPFQNLLRSKDQTAMYFWPGGKA